jgi:hypothetical protein
MKIEIRGFTHSEASFDKLIETGSLLPISAQLAIEAPLQVTDTWINDINRFMAFYALDIAAVSYERSLVFAFKTALEQEPDENGVIYAYSTRSDQVQLNQMLIDAIAKISDKYKKIKPLLLQTFRSDIFQFISKNCSFVPTNNEFHSVPFSMHILNKELLNSYKLKHEPIKVTFPHRVLIDSFGNYRAYQDRIFKDRLELAIILGFKTSIVESELFINELSQYVAEEGDSDKITNLINFLKSSSDLEKNTDIKNRFTTAHLKLPHLFREKPYSRFGNIGSVTGFEVNNNNDNEPSFRYSIAHRGKHLALIDVIPNLAKRPLKGYARQLQGSPTKYQYLVINSMQYGSKIFPSLPIVSLDRELPLDIVQYLPETKAFSMLDQRDKLNRKSHLLGGFFINPLKNSLPYTAKNTQQIVDETQRLAEQNPTEVIIPEYFSVDHDFIVKSKLSAELVDALRFFRDRNAIHESYSVKSKAPSLPGAQSKLPVAFQESRNGIEIKPSASFDDQRFTHILKLPVDLSNASDDKEKSGLCALEFLGMFTASKLGLEVPRFGLVSWPSLIKELDIGNPKGDLSKEPAYIIERFDITNDPNKNYILKEFVALMGERDKFKNTHGTPHTAESVCLALKKYSTDFELDKFKLLRFFIVNEIIGNTDMHLKNIAMIELRDAEKNLVSCRLSPSYDIASVDALNPVFFLNSNDPNYAKGVTYNGKVRPNVSDWVCLAETSLDITAKQCLDLIDDIISKATIFLNTYAHRHVSVIFSTNLLLKAQYDRAMRRLELGINILKNRSHVRNLDSTPFDEFYAVWQKSFEEAQNDEVKVKFQQQAIKVGGETLNRSVLIGENILAALLLPENSGEKLDGKSYIPGGSNQVMISDANIVENKTLETFPCPNDLPDFLRG